MQDEENSPFIHSSNVWSDCSFNWNTFGYKKRKERVRRPRLEDRTRLIHDGDLDMTFLAFLSFSSENERTEPPHDKTNKMACAPSEDSDQPGSSLSS